MIRKKPKFYRVEWHRKIRLGSIIRKKRKWRGAKGKHNKVRMNLKGRSQRPRVGWGANKKGIGLVSGLKPILIENKKQLEMVEKGYGAIIIAGIGRKKRVELIKIAEEKKIPILNNYKSGGKNATK